MRRNKESYSMSVARIERDLLRVNDALARRMALSANKVKRINSVAMEVGK